MKKIQIIFKVLSFNAIFNSMDYYYVFPLFDEIRGG